MGPILAKAGDLARWADSLYAQGLLPKLVRQLILATTESGLDPKRWSQQTWMLGLVYDKLVFETVHLLIGNWACIL